jgi:hypothetical protein
MDEWNFAIVQDGQTVAEGSGPRDFVLQEAAHYVRMYGQDGECLGHVWQKGSRRPRLPAVGQGAGK